MTSAEAEVEKKLIDFLRGCFSPIAIPVVGPLQKFDKEKGAGTTRVAVSVQTRRYKHNGMTMATLPIEVDLSVALADDPVGQEYQNLYSIMTMCIARLSVDPSILSVDDFFECQGCKGTGGDCGGWDDERCAQTATWTVDADGRVKDVDSFFSSSTTTTTNE